MSRKGMLVAKQFASGLPVFASLREAESALFQSRDNVLNQLLDNLNLENGLDFSPASLKTLEQWYFHVGQPKSVASGLPTSMAIGFYWGEVCCRHSDFRWVVKEYAFERGRYEIGIERSLLTVMLSKGKLPPSTANKRKQSLWREFQRYVSSS